MLSCLLVGDVHITDDTRRPAGRKAGYEQQILDKLAFCVETANKLSVPIVQLGDMFNLKAASKTTHRVVQSVHEVLKQANNGVWFVVGNHDITNDRLESLPSQPLGALCRMKGMQFLIGETADLPGVAGIPYITEFDGGDWQEALRNRSNFGITTPELLVTHAPIFPLGQEPGVYASISPNDWETYFPDIPNVSYGHIHNPHFTHYNERKTVQFANFGAISRGSLHEESVNRQLQVALYDSGSYTAISIPFEAPEEVFLLDEADRKKLNKASADEFSQIAGSVSIPRLTIADAVAKIREQASSHEVMKIVEQVLEDAQ